MPSKRSKQVSSFLVMDVLERADRIEKEGHEVIHMEIGEPDFDTPPVVVEAGIEAIRQGHTHYTHSKGRSELRVAIQQWHSQHYGTEFGEDQIIVTAGTSLAMTLLFSAILDPGDEVILSDPHYACYPNFIRFAGGVPVFIPTTAQDGFQLDAKIVQKAVTDRTKAILINSPSNPTGALLTANSIKQLADLDILIISDEIYHGLVYEGCAHSILEFTENGVVINGFSKLFAMTGWRLGYSIVPQKLVRPMQKLQQNLVISACDFSQKAAIAALRHSQQDISNMADTYNERRRFLVPELRNLGFKIPYDPSGAFYVLADARHLGKDSSTLAFDILENVHVAVTPGIDFGSTAEGHLRFSYTNSLKNLREGIVRLSRYLDNRNMSSKSYA